MDLCDVFRTKGVGFGRAKRGVCPMIDNNRSCGLLHSCYMLINNGFLPVQAEGFLLKNPGADPSHLLFYPELHDLCKYISAFGLDLPISKNIQLLAWCNGIFGSLKRENMVVSDPLLPTLLQSRFTLSSIAPFVNLLNPTKIIIKKNNRITPKVSIIYWLVVYLPL